MLEVQRGVVVRLRDVGEERSQADPRVVVIDTCTAQRHADLVDIRQGSGREALKLRVLNEVGEVTRETEMIGDLMCGYDEGDGPTAL